MKNLLIIIAILSLANCTRKQPAQQVQGTTFIDSLNQVVDTIRISSRATLELVIDKPAPLIIKITDSYKAAERKADSNTVALARATVTIASLNTELTALKATVATMNTKLTATTTTANTNKTNITTLTTASNSAKTNITNLTAADTKIKSDLTLTDNIAKDAQAKHTLLKYVKFEGFNQTVVKDTIIIRK